MTRENLQVDGMAIAAGNPAIVTQGNIAAKPVTCRQPLFLRTLRALDRAGASKTCVAATLVILLIGVMSFATGPDLSSSLLYLIPVILVTRAAGLHAGIAAALLATVIWFTVELNALQTNQHAMVPYWNALMRLGTFTVAVGLVTAMRSLTNHLEERVRERTSALEAEIAEKRELEKKILEISDTERAAVGQDLHDGLCQQLVGVAFSCTMLEERLANVAPGQVKEVVAISEMIDDAITQARNLARGLFPVRLEAEGLGMALRELASNINRRFGASCFVECEDHLPESGRTTAMHLYRIAQEAAVNAAKYSQSQRIVIRLARSTRGVRLSVVDRGRGLGSTSNNPDGMGLKIMEYRARLIDAVFEIGPAGKQGTRVSCEVDIETYQR